MHYQSTVQVAWPWTPLTPEMLYVPGTRLRVNVSAHLPNENLAVAMLTAQQRSRIQHDMDDRQGYPMSLWRATLAEPVVATFQTWSQEPVQIGILQNWPTFPPMVVTGAVSFESDGSRHLPPELQVSNLVLSFVFVACCASMLMLTGLHPALQTLQKPFTFGLPWLFPTEVFYLATAACGFDPCRCHRLSLHLSRDFFCGLEACAGHLYHGPLLPHRCGLEDHTATSPQFRMDFRLGGDGHRPLTADDGLPLCLIGCLQPRPIQVDGLYGERPVLLGDHRGHEFQHLRADAAAAGVTCLVGGLLDLCQILCLHEVSHLLPILHHAWGDERCGHACVPRTHCASDEASGGVAAVDHDPVDLAAGLYGRVQGL